MCTQQSLEREYVIMSAPPYVPPCLSLFEQYQSPRGAP